MIGTEFVHNGMRRGGGGPDVGDKPAKRTSDIDSEVCYCIATCLVCSILNDVNYPVRSGATLKRSLLLYCSLFGNDVRYSVRSRAILKSMICSLFAMVKIKGC